MNILYCLRRAKQFHGDAIASYREAGSTTEQITWNEFYDRVHRAAAHLRELGIQKGDRVAIWMLNSHEYLELYYATAIAGIVVVPLNTRWNESDVAFTLKDSEAVALIVDERFAPLAERLAHAPRLIYAGAGACPAGMIPYGYSDATLSFDEPDEQDLVGLFYTSGTTGGPKGAMLTHRNLWSNLLHSLLVNMRKAIWLHSAPMFHLADLGAMFSITTSGGTHCYLPTFDPEICMQLIERYRVTDTVLVPTMLNMVIHSPAFGKYDLSSLVNFLYGASPMPEPLIRTAMKQLPAASFRQGYGLTEASPVLTYLNFEDHFGDAVSSAGKPVFGTEVRVVDEFDRDVPAGQCGEVIARGANIMKGYWKRPDITAEVLRGGWLHTGDIGRFDENGFLYILDRKKDMIKPGGENVYTPEVESMVAALPAVLEVAVIGVADDKWGEAIRAVVTRRPGADLTEDELIGWCRERMTHFKCPSSVVFVDTLPKGGTGKVQKGVLREKYGSASSDPCNPGAPT
jgi:long-chain acyl-CoA synthetase